MASDGDPTHTTIAHLIIHVQDVNDCSPEFTKDFYEYEVDENTEADSLLFIQVNFLQLFCITFITFFDRPEMMIMISSVTRLKMKNTLIIFRSLLSHLVVSG